MACLSPRSAGVRIGDWRNEIFYENTHSSDGGMPDVCGTCVIGAVSASLQRMTKNTKWMETMGKSEDMSEAAAKVVKSVMDAQMAPMSKIMGEFRANADLFGKLNQTVARCTQTLFARHTSAVQEAFDEMTSIVQGAQQAKDMTALSELQRKYGVFAMKHAVEQLKVAVDAAAEVSDMAFDLTRGRLDNMIEATGEAVGESGAAKKPPARGK